MKKILIPILLLILVSVGLAQEEPDVPKLTNYVNDFTGTLTREQIYKLEQSLRALDKKTSTQIVVLMIPTLNGYPLEMYSYDVAAKNKIGTKGNDNGILFLIVKNDKKMRIEVGYGLEGALPDALASSIIRNRVAPFFRKGEYYKGLISGLNAIVSAVQGEYVNKDNREKDVDKGGHGFWFYVIFFILMIIFSRMRGPGGLIFLGGFGGFGGGSSGGFGGGGFGGGGFSGGGGSFGGGGASGGW